MKKLYTALLVAGAACLLATPAQATGGWEKGACTIMLDPGHGGSDPGAGRSGYRYEADLVLDACLAMNEWLNAKGSPHRLTRTTNATVSLGARRSASISYDPWVFCSVHLNAFNGTANGTETWYYWASRSPVLAQKTQAALVSKLQRVNRGVKQNGWTVITGGAHIPAILTEALFVDNVTENNMINNRSNAGFKNWVNAHLKGFFDFMNSEGAGISLNPDSDPWGGTPPPPTPAKALEAPTGVNFTINYGDANPEWDIEVKGTSLTENITVTSTTAARFEFSTTSLGKTGGKVHVKLLEPYGDHVLKVGTYGEGGTAVNYRLAIKFVSSGLTKEVLVTGEVKPHPLNDLAEKWNLSVKRGNKDNKGYDATKIRNFCYKDGKLYGVYNHKDIIVLNAKTGEKLGFMKRGDVVKGGTLQLCDVKTVSGKIVACNLATAANGEKLRIYAWDSDNAAPYLVLETDNFQGANRLGDCMELNGNFDSDCWFSFGNENGKTRIIEFRRNNGQWSNQNFEVISKWGDVESNLSTQATVRVYHQSGGWWIDGKDSYPAWCTLSNGKAVRQTYVDTGESWGSSHHEFYWGGQKHSANLVFNGKEYKNNALDPNTTYLGARMRFIQDPTGDFTRAVQVADYPKDGLRESKANASDANTNATGDCIINTDGSNYIEAWVLSTADGMAYFAKGSVPEHTVAPLELQEPEGDTPSPVIAVDKATLTFNVKVDNTASQALVVTGKNLTAGITAWIEGGNSSMFSVSPASLGAGGGTMNVTYTPGSAAGSHSAKLCLASNGAKQVEVALNGTAEPNIVFVDDIPAAKIQTVWESSQNAGTKSWHNATDGGKNFARAIAYQNGKLYVVQNKSWAAPEIVILNAYNGEKTGNLSATGITGATIQLGDITAFDGKIIGTNVVTAAQTFNIYVWDDDNANPRVIKTFTGVSGNVGGASVAATGTWNSGRIYVGIDGGNKIAYLDVNGGNVGDIHFIDLKKADGTAFAHTSMGRGTTCIVPMADGSFWINNSNYGIQHIGADGKVIETMKTGSVRNTNGAALAMIDFGAHKYLATTDYTSTFTGAKFVLVKVTDGIAGADQALFTAPDATFGSTNNDQRNSQAILVKDRDNGHTLDMWAHVTKGGIAHYSYKGATDQVGVDGIAIDNDGDNEAQYYNLQGIRMDADNLTPGVYIRRQGTKAEKVVIR